MRKTYLLTLALSAFMLSGVSAQQVRNCGTMDHLHEAESNDPKLQSRMHEIEVRSQEWIRNYENTSNKSAVVVTIPVVVHVVYNTATQNISDAQIQSQLNILNQDFRKLNSDISLVPSVFSGLAADCEIEFCLAKRDPNGNATTGIVRKSTTVTSFSSNDNIKRNANGGSDPWNTSQYLNIWVGNLSGGLLGYAQFPGGPAATDGVVCLFTAFGNTGVAAAPFNKGRTATHEVGHWLNLRHIWGDATCGNDLVNDTPTQQTSNFGCPSFPRVTCSNGPNGDMFMNYMDYTDDACMYMFTTGQKTRMLAALNTTRASLLTSLGCVPPSGGTTCGVPASLSATSITTTGATLNWGTVSGAASYNIQYRQTGTTTWTTVTSTTTSRTISGLQATTTYEFQVQAVCTGATSAFSASSTFSTPAAACTDVYESNNSRANSKTIALNADITARISSGTDRDWFKFTTVAGGTNLRVVLDQLPADYDLRLYGPSGGTLATSQLSGTSTETIIRNTASTNSYFVQVYPYSSTGFNANVCYRLRVNTSSSPFRSGTQDDYTEGNINLEKMAALDGINVYPNPTNDQLNLSFFMESESNVNIEVVDLMGKVVYSGTLNGIEGFNKTELSTASFSNGIYILKITQDQASAIQKFMVKH